MSSERKKGRPKSMNPKNINIKVRFDEKLYTSFIKYCNTHNITRTEAIRQGVYLLLQADK